MYDFHVHTHFSDDSIASVASMVEAAYKKNLKGLCITDHIDIDYPSYTGAEFIFDYKEYFHEINEQKQKYINRMDVLTGVELGLQPHIAGENAAFLAGKHFDFVLGSIHCTKKKDLYTLEYLKGISEQQGILNYFEDLLDCIRGFSDFDVLGHIDVIRRYVEEIEDAAFYNNYYEQLEAALKNLIAAGKGIEINTSGHRYRLSTFHPMPEILKLYKTLGGEILTIGSDSHKAADLGYGLKDAQNIISDIGFKYYTIFKARKPEFIKL